LDPLGLEKEVTVSGVPTTNTNVGGRFGIKVEDPPHQLGDSIQAASRVNWRPGEGLGGWIVQHVRFEYDVKNDEDGLESTNWVQPTVTEFWEAWKVTAEGFLEMDGEDNFQTPLFPEDSYGSFSIIGKVDFYTTEALEGVTNTPDKWTGRVEEAGFYQNQEEAPNWWNGTGYNHTLTLTWE
jgi:hypothetical protein